LFARFPAPKLVAFALPFRTNSVTGAVLRAFGDSITRFAFKSNVAKTFAILADSMAIAAAGTFALAFFLRFAVGA
jgi:hypothetical protein